MDVIISGHGGKLFSGQGGSELPKTAGIVVNISAIVFISYFYIVCKSLGRIEFFLPFYFVLVLI